MNDNDYLGVGFLYLYSYSLLKFKCLYFIYYVSNIYINVRIIIYYLINYQIK